MTGHSRVTERLEQGTGLVEQPQPVPGLCHRVAIGVRVAVKVGATELRELRLLREEGGKLERLVAALSLALVQGPAMTVTRSCFDRTISEVIAFLLPGTVV